MEYCLSEINKPADDYFEHKAGDVLKAPETKEKYYIHKYFPGRIDVSISSYIGISIGAIHFYGKINYNPIRVSDNKKGTNTVGGYLGGLDIDDFLEIRMDRLLTKEECREDPDRWGKYYTGQFTGCFETVEQLIICIIKAIKKIFPKKEIRYNCEKMNSFKHLKERIKRSLF